MRKRERASTRTKRLPTDEQRGFFFTGELGPDRSRAPGDLPVRGEAIFDRGNRCNLWVGSVKLENYLVERDLGWVIELEELIAASDVSALLNDYRPRLGGRRPFHPRIMLGLIVYGLLTRRQSLRELEIVAQTDVCAWYLTGGLQPDHSTIGNFVVRHATVLTDEYFRSLTKQLVERLGRRCKDAAFVGTVVEAAASHFKTLQKEAAAREAANLTARAAAEPEDARLQAQAERAEKVVEVIDTRAQERAAYGRDGASVQVPRSEPDAIVQLLKNGAVRPAYKPSVVATTDRLIVGQVVDPSSETGVLERLLEQHREVLGGIPETALLDAGYHSGPVLRSFADANINVLCPSGKGKGEDDFQKAGNQQFAKSRFCYDEATDRYLCPAQKWLLPLTYTEHEARGGTYRHYQAQPADCAQCPLRAQCTDSAKGRSVRRYADEAYKDGMNAVFRQPAAREHYRQRKAMVEPVFSELRECQGLRRFHRKGLLLVAAEFALHCIAYNLRRAIRLRAAAAAAAAAAVLLLLATVLLPLVAMLRRPRPAAAGFGFNRARYSGCGLHANPSPA